MRQHYTQAQIYHARSSKEKRCWGVYFVFIGRGRVFLLQCPVKKTQRPAAAAGIHLAMTQLEKLRRFLVFLQGLKGSHDIRISPKGMK